MSLVRTHGSSDRMIHDTAVRRVRLPAGSYSPMLRSMVGSSRKASGTTPLEPLTDVLVHGQDIAILLGRERPMPLEAAVAADRVWSMGFPFRARRRLAGLHLRATDHPWEAGDGEPVEGPLAALLLLLTGRTAGIPPLDGSGTDRPRPSGSR